MAKTLAATIIILTICTFGSLHAALIDNGGGLIYDTDRNITWYVPNLGPMTWSQAVSWVAGLSVSNANVDNVKGWRLPSALNQDGAGLCDGYNCSESEMGHLYYTELGNTAQERLAHKGPFASLQEGNYWTALEWKQFPGNAWAFGFEFGLQGFADKNLADHFFAMAVHDGDVGASVPERIVIDIGQWNKRNPSNYNGRGILPVSIISTEDFDVPNLVDQRSLTFGATGHEKSLAFCNPKQKHVNRDGSMDDLVCYFYVDLAGFKCGDTKGVLKGETFDGSFIEGRDLVRITNCK
jgi:hypothetical protein